MNDTKQADRAAFAARKSAPTLRVVAARAGVSIAIASRVANGHFTGMTRETRLRVQEAIRALAYRPNRVARSLRTSRHYRVALLAVDTSPEFLADPFHTYIAAGLSNALSEANYGLLLQRLDPRNPSEALIERAQDTDALTVYLSGGRGDRRAILRRLAAMDLPLVVIQEPVRINRSNICVVRQDDRNGALSLARLVAQKRGAKKALIVVPRRPWAAIDQRVSGFRDGLGKNCQVELFRVDENDLTSVLAALVTRLRSNIPDVIMAQHDLLAVQAIHALRHHGLSVPQDVGVTGFNAFPTTGVIDPPLTTVKSPASRLGIEAARSLLEYLETGKFSAREILLPVETVVGASL